MPRDKTRDLRKMNRRNFLSKLSAMGISGATLQYMTKDALAEVTDDPTDEIPRLQSMRRKYPDWQERDFPEKLEREPVYYTIQRDDWVRVESARDAASRVGKFIDERIDDPSEIRVGVTTIVDGQHSKKAVKVKVKTESVSRVRERLPASINGEVGSGQHKEVRENIPVVVDEDRAEKLHDCRHNDNNSYYNEDYGHVPGGAQVEACTSGAPAWDYDREEVVMLTAAHCVGAGEGTDTEYHGETMNQPENGSLMGESDKVSHESDNYEDVATINPELSSEPVPSYKLAGWGGGEDEPIWGIIGWDCIKDMEDGNAPYDQMYKQGETTGRCSGPVDYTNLPDYSNGHQEFNTDAWAEGGDSGGPNFVMEDDHVLIAGITKAGLQGGANYTAADAVEYIEDIFNLSI